MLLKKPKTDLMKKLKDPAAWVVPDLQVNLLKNPKQPEIQEINIEHPAVVRTKTGVEVRIDAYGNVTIIGQNSFKFKCEGDMEFEADSISMRVKDTHRIESEKHIIQKAARIDFNPLDEINLEIPESGKEYIKTALKQSREKCK